MEKKKLRNKDPIFVEQNQTLGNITMILTYYSENDIQLLDDYSTITSKAKYKVVIGKGLRTLALFRMDFLGVAHGWWIKKPSLLLKLRHTYPTLTKLGSYTLPKEDPKKNHVTYPLSSDDISIYSPKISNFYYMKKHRYRLYLNA